MSASKSRLFVVFVLTAILTAFPVPGASGQAAPAAPASADSTRASQPTPKPRPQRFGLPDPPTARPASHKEAAGLKAAMDWPGSVLTGAAIMGNLAEATFLKASDWSSMLATNATGAWVKINQTDGCYTTDEIVQALQTISSCEAEELSAVATVSRARWAEANKSPKPMVNVALFNKYQEEGNSAAGSGDFDSAIAAWTKAEAFDNDDVTACRSEFQRVQIRAAEDAEAQMEIHHLTKQAAAHWFLKHEGELWMRSCCNLP